MGTEKRDRQRANRQLRLEELRKTEQKQRRKKRTLQYVIGGVIAVALVIGAAYLFSSGDDDGGDVSAGDTTTSVADGSTTTAAPATTAAPPTTFAPPTTVAGATITGETPCPEADGSSPRTISFEQAPPMCIDPGKTYTATVTTNKGEFTMDLDAALAPQTVNNFVVLSRYHYYDGVTCHRIITDFAVQCGDPAGTGAGEYPGYTIPDELPAEGAYKDGSVAMANTGQPDTGGGQFFIVVGPDGAALPPQYSILGQVTQGYDSTVAAMEAAADPNASNGVPTAELVYIQNVTIAEK